tara:strand:+ start:2413 stop:2952 length:540 start_codon:yes stop_codon:yes gene_type:complete
MTLLNILLEEKNDDANLRKVKESPTPLLQGRPSARMAEVKARAVTDPSGLLSDLGIGSINASTVSDYLHKLFTAMVSGGRSEGSRYLKDFFKAPELVSSSSGKRKGIVVALTGEGKRNASEFTDTKKMLRTYAFWFKSTLIAAKSVRKSSLELANVKFQFLNGEDAIIIYSSRKAWDTL